MYVGPLISSEVGLILPILDATKQCSGLTFRKYIRAERTERSGKQERIDIPGNMGCLSVYCLVAVLYFKIYSKNWKGSGNGIRRSENKILDEKVTFIKTDLIYSFQHYNMDTFA